MTIFDDYIAYTDKYKALYGDSTLVLMEVGSFYEIYGVDNIMERCGADVSGVCDLLNIQMSRKNKAILENSKSNPLMAGFPNYVLKKFMDILIQNNYTVVLVEQTTPPPNPKREVTTIVSPATYIDNLPSSDKNLLMCIYFFNVATGGRGVTRNYILATCSCIDLSTGESFIYEVSNEHQDSSITLEDVYRFVIAHRPREIVLFGDDIQDDWKEQVSDWVNRFAICVHNKISCFDTSVLKLSYQNAVLTKVFPKTGLLSVIEYLDLERKPHSVTCFVYLLNFVYEHNEKIATRIWKPVIMEHHTTMILANNCIEHLNIIPKDSRIKTKTASLLTFLNNCSTSMGRRYFRERLLNPIIDVATLDAHYQMIDFLKEKERYTYYHDILQQVVDLERLFRKLSLKLLQPCEFAAIDQSLNHVLQLHEHMHLTNDQPPPPPECVSLLKWTEDHYRRLKMWIQTYSAIFDLQELAKYTTSTLSGTIFINGQYPSIDLLQESIKKQCSYFENLVKALNSICGGDEDTWFKLDTNERGEYSLSITKKRYESFVATLKTRSSVKETLKTQFGFTEGLEMKPISASNKTLLKVANPHLTLKNNELLQSKTALRIEVTETYMELLETYHHGYSDLFTYIVNFVATLDYFVNNTKNAERFHYQRPNVVSRPKSFICSKGIRHPLIEVIQSSIPYVTNDIDLGTEVDGMLLYGINAVGKSSLMKSVGMNLVMAQAGMYVAAGSFEFAPYEYLFTRIPGGDNMFKAQSTFSVEMSELRTILKKANHRALVIGDELCSGTESVSAISIVAAGIKLLASKHTSFIFATHLHEIATLPHVTELNNVAIYHMAVHYEEATQKLVYDRRLKEGSGDTLYGLEVCKSLDLDPEFLHMANKIRQHTIGMNTSIVEPKRSRYNAAVFVDSCSVCGKPTEEIHHIKHQKEANAKGYIGHFHKNSKFNLMNVCGGCHDKIHANKVVVHGYVQTSEGVELAVNDAEEPQRKTSDEELVNVVRALKNGGMSIPRILAHVSEQFHVQLTRYGVQKMIQQ
jgi:DNA mismatch repair protein MutS